jgi:hypothetical protein
MKSRWVSLVGTAVALTWVVGSSVYLYPDVKEEIDEKRYLHRVEKLHTPVLSIDCARARGVENRDFIREDASPDQCWMTIPAFKALFPDIAGATDLAGTLRMQEREELPQDRWDGTPVEAVAQALAIVLGPPLGALLLLRGRRRFSTRDAPKIG